MKHLVCYARTESFSWHLPWELHRNVTVVIHPNSFSYPGRFFVNAVETTPCIPWMRALVVITCSFGLWSRNGLILSASAWSSSWVCEAASALGLFWLGMLAVPTFRVIFGSLAENCCSSTSDFFCHWIDRSRCVCITARNNQKQQPPIASSAAAAVAVATWHHQPHERERARVREREGGEECLCVRVWACVSVCVCVCVCVWVWVSDFVTVDETRWNEGNDTPCQTERVREREMKLGRRRRKKKKSDRMNKRRLYGVTVD